MQESTNNDGKKNNYMNSLEVAMIGGVLKHKDVLVKEVMTTEVFVLSINENLSVQVSHIS